MALGANTHVTLLQGYTVPAERGIRQKSERLHPHLIEPQLLDRGIDMGCADMEIHPVKLGQLVFQSGNDTGQAGTIRCRGVMVFKAKCRS